MTDVSSHITHSLRASRIRIPKGSNSSSNSRLILHRHAIMYLYYATMPTDKHKARQESVQHDMQHVHV